MTGFGDELRREREARGVDMDSVCAATKVSAQNLRALEAGDYARLPGGVFRKGIVRAYLAALSLDQEVWMERFEASVRESGVREAGDRDWVQFAENVKRGRSGEPVGMGWRWVGVALLLAGLGAVAWFAWHYVLQRKFAVREVATEAVASRRSMPEIAVRVPDREHRLSGFAPRADA